jgi:hypothetical protein
MKIRMEINFDLREVCKYLDKNEISNEDVFNYLRKTNFKAATFKELEKDYKINESSSQNNKGELNRLISLFQNS